MRPLQRYSHPRSRSSIIASSKSNLTLSLHYYYYYSMDVVDLLCLEVLLFFHLLPFYSLMLPNWVHLWCYPWAFLGKFVVHAIHVRHSLTNISTIRYYRYIMIDITINVIQTPIRSFCSDQVPTHMQNTVQLMSVAFQGLGGIIGAQLQATLYKQTVDTLPLLMFPVLAINLVLIPLVCWVAVETPFPGTGEKVNLATPFTSVFKNLKNIDRKLGVIFAVQFFSWASLFTYWPHSTNWVQINVFGGCLQLETDKLACPEGSAGDLLAKEGNVFAGNASTVQSTVQLVFGLLFGYLLVARVLKRVKPIYSLGLAIGSVAAILTNVIETKTYAFIFISVMGLQMSVINAFPFAIVGEYNSGDGGLETGVQFGMMNMFITGRFL